MESPFKWSCQKLYIAIWRINVTVNNRNINNTPGSFFTISVKVHSALSRGLCKFKIIVYHFDLYFLSICIRIFLWKIFKTKKCHNFYYLRLFFNFTYLFFLMYCFVKSIVKYLSPIDQNLVFYRGNIEVNVMAVLCFFITLLNFTIMLYTTTNLKIL